MWQVGIALISRSVCVPREIEPPSSPTFAVTRIVQQLFDQLFVCPRVVIIDKLIDVGGSRRQTDQIEIQTTNQRATRCFFRRLKSVSFQLGQDERVDVVPNPSRVVDGWDGDLIGNIIWPGLFNRENTERWHCKEMGEQNRSPRFST